MSQGIRHWIFWKKEIRAMLYLRRTTSLNNLKNNRPIAQVATILILIIVAGLIFILATVNLGSVSIKTTQTANAADSSTLYLASQLASKANNLWNQLEQKLEMCKKGGMLGIILAIIVAVVLTIASYGLLTVVAGAALAGMVGGAIVHGTAQGAAMGAIQGAAIGAAVYGGVYAFGGGPVPVEGAMEAGLAGGFEWPMTTGIVSTSGAVAGGTLAAGTSLYSGYVQERMNSAAMSALAKQLSGLPEYESVREGVFFYALNQVVDDPNKVQDIEDLDSDGDTSEMVPAFTYWWDEHIKGIKAGLSSAADSIESFFEGSLIPFYQDAQDFLSYMDRKEVECDCSPGESPSTLLFGAIKSSGYSIFWEPGPDKQSLINWYESDCGNCAPPAGFDDFDGARMQYEEFIDYSTGLLKPDESGGYNYDADTLDKALRQRPGVAGEDDWDWFDFLYNPDLDADEDFYDVFKTISPTIGDWNENIIAVRDGLAGCKLAYMAGLDDSVYQAGSFCQCYPPIYPCNWLRTGSSSCGEPYDECGLQSICSDAPREPHCGIWLPNPLCKLYPEDKEILLAQIATVEDFVSNLEEHIKRKYFPNPCPDCSLVGNIEIQVLEICLSDGTISYRFHYKYTCSCCDEVCDPEGNCEPVCTDTTYQGEMWGEDPIGAPDLRISGCKGKCPSKGGFLGILSEMRGALGSVGDDFATIDEDWEDEFKPVIEKLEEQIGVIEGFLPDVERFNDDIEGVTNTRAVDGRGEVTYSWEDSLGKHSVKVETGPFKLAYIKKKTSGSFLKNKTCLQLRDYEDDGSSTWVEITRQDPGEKEITPSGTTNLGLKWNPFFSGKIARKSKAYYSYDKVGIKGISD